MAEMTSAAEPASKPGSHGPQEGVAGDQHPESMVVTVTAGATPLPPPLGPQLLDVGTSSPVDNDLRLKFTVPSGIEYKYSSAIDENDCRALIEATKKVARLAEV